MALATGFIGRKCFRRGVMKAPPAQDVDIGIGRYQRKGSKESKSL